MRLQERKNRSRITLGIPGSKTALSWLVPTKRAKKPVAINGDISHALQGAAGVSVGCALSNCVLSNKDAFPHPVIFAAVYKSKVFIVSKLDSNGHPKECIEYDHRYGHITDANDARTLKKMVKEQPELMARPFTLRVPLNRTVEKRKWADRPEEVKRKIKANEKANGTSGTSKARGAAVAERGALRRAVRAGLVAPGVAAHLQKLTA